MTTTPRALHLAALLALALAAGGCSDPYQTADNQPPATTPAPRLAGRGPVAGEQPGTIPERERRALNAPQARPARTPQAAARAYATAATTWTASTIAARYRQLASTAVGQARRDAQQTAATAATDPELGAGSASSRGRVRGALADHQGCLLVVVDQRIAAAGGDPPRRQTSVYRACTRHVPGGYAVERFDHQ